MFWQYSRITKWLINYPYKMYYEEIFLIWIKYVYAYILKKNNFKEVKVIINVVNIHQAKIKKKLQEDCLLKNSTIKEQSTRNLY